MRKKLGRLVLKFDALLTQGLQEALFVRAVEKFVNVDGNLGKTVMPFPFDAHWNKDVLQYADMSVADRIEQLKTELSDDERNAVEALVLVCSGGTRDNSSFLDFLRWWAAGGHNFSTLWDTLIVFKLKCGQSGFAIRFFNEALATGNLSYSFSTTVSRVDSSQNIVRVRSSDGQEFHAKRLICTVPLNVLNKVQFEPPLDPAKTEASRLKHVNQCCKVHAEVKDPEMRSWDGITYPHNRLLLGTADGTTPAGNTHCVFFGCYANHLHADESIDETLKAINEFAPMEVERLVSAQCFARCFHSALLIGSGRSPITGQRTSSPRERGKCASQAFFLLYQSD